jgi:hypothetical protein
VDYFDCNSSAYCHWRLADAAEFLRSHLQLAYAPSGVTLTALMPVVLLHLEEDERTEAQCPDKTLSTGPGSGTKWFSDQGNITSLEAQLIPAPAAQAGASPEGTAAATSEEQLAASEVEEVALPRQCCATRAASALDVLEVLASVGHHPGHQVS